MTEPLSAEQRALLAEQLGDAKPARDALLASFGKSIQERAEHDHTSQREDWFCLNLAAYMGERMAPVLRRLLDAETEVARLTARVAELEPYERLNPQQCPKGIHADWLVDSEYAHACPWCRVAELERPEVERKRSEIQLSYRQLAAQAREDGDSEGEATVLQRLESREAAWRAEDTKAGWTR